MLCFSLFRLKCPCFGSAGTHSPSLCFLLSKRGHGAGAVALKPTLRGAAPLPWEAPGPAAAIPAGNRPGSARASLRQDSVDCRGNNPCTRQRTQQVRRPLSCSESQPHPPWLHLPHRGCLTQAGKCPCDPLEGIIVIFPHNCKTAQQFYPTTGIKFSVKI